MCPGILGEERPEDSTHTSIRRSAREDTTLLNFLDSLCILKSEMRSRFGQLSCLRRKISDVKQQPTK
jgi:hypothetical protein